MQLHQAGTMQWQRELLDAPLRVNEPLWWNVYRLERNDIHGWADLHVLMTIEGRGRTKTYRTDNHRTSSHAPLRIYCSPDSLPRMEGLQYGDAHTHSDKTSDQVEFGVPVNAAILLAQSMGLTYFCVADHSYDLDDSPADYTVNHPDIPKWGDLTREVKLANARNRKFAVIQGEEISCRNDEGRNVHFLLFGNKEFFSGSGDSAEQWFKTHSEHSIADILARKDSGAVAFAAHPSEPVPFLQRLLLARGAWTTADFSQHGLAGIQFANGAAGEGFSEGYSAWVAMLLRGHRLFCLAGNDAHGNFNRYRQIGIPFVSIREHGEQLFGRMRTAVYLEGRPGQRAVLESLAAGSFVITDGPCINVTDSTDKESPTVIGRTLRRGKRNLVFSAVSS
ncbi:MAG TPA: hypothetical protein VMM37_05930, partial [Bacteroidota bacterium]|nr:hypothetical protein [Bacteroidota bacterium]